MTLHERVVAAGDWWDLAADWLIAIGTVALIVAAVVILFTVGVLWLAQP